MKSSVGVSLRLEYDTRLTFVTTHLPHGPENVALRVRDYHILRSAMQFNEKTDQYISDE